MFLSFSWNDFITCILLLYTLYYVAVIGIYYRAELNQILSDRLNFIRVPVKGNSSSLINPVQADEDKMAQLVIPNSPAQVASEQSDPQEELHQLLLHLQRSIIKASEEKTVKQELLWMVRSLLQKYHHLKNTDNIIAVNDFVIQLVENHCSISLTESDLSPLWN